MCSYNLKNMFEEKYEEAIAFIKEKYPKYEKSDFILDDGVLGYSNYGTKVDNIEELQQEVNYFLGTKRYIVDCIGYAEVYARDEQEAIEFAKRMNEKPCHFKPKLMI